MPTRRLGRDGPAVSLIGLGCNNFGARIDAAPTRTVVDAALAHGISLFDTADVYGEPKGESERLLGAALGPRRKDVVIATKFGKPMDDARTLRGGARAYVTAAAEASLRRLGTDWIDLYQMHEPDPGVPIDETLRALEDLIRAGKVRHIGSSNFNAEELASALDAAASGNLPAFIVCQDEWSLVEHGIERNLLPLVRARGLAVLPYFPLASGLLTGKYRADAAIPADARFAHWPKLGARYLTTAKLARVAVLERFAAERGHSLLELAFAWLTAQPEVASIIAGATRPEQVALNARAAGWTLSPTDLAAIDALDDADR